MFRRTSGLIKKICAVTVILSLLLVTGCSTNGFLGGLFGGGGNETTTTSAAVSSSTTAATSETTTKKSSTTTSQTTKAASGSGGSSTSSSTSNSGGNSGGDTEPEGTTEHVHNWVKMGGGVPACTADGGVYYACLECGATYEEVIPALGHDWEFVYHKDPLCLDPGFDEYKCSRCGEIEDRNQDQYPATGHNYNGIIPDYSEGLEDMGHINYCDACGYEFYDTYEAHNLSYYPMVGDETMYHVYYCYKCGYSSYEPHTMSGGTCIYCGYTGPVG